MIAASQREGQALGLRVALISPVRNNPYVRLLRDGLIANAPGLHCTLTPRLTPAWLLPRLKRVNVLHLHWIELQYQADRRWQRQWRFGQLRTALQLAQRARVRIVYTVHNLAPHEGQEPELNRQANDLIFRVADAVHVHDTCTAQAVAERYAHARHITVIPHPSYVGHYPNQVSRSEARAQLGLDPAAFVYLSLGLLRPYKGMEDLIAAFQVVQAEFASALLIAGQAHDRRYAERLQALAQSQSGVQVRVGYVPDDQVQLYLNAADVSVFPYQQVTTSGAALLALSFGCPVVAPAIGPFPELVGQNQRGTLYAAGALVDGLRAAQHLELIAARRAALAFAQARAWPVVAGQYWALYESLV